jgi:hypothetical protein
MRDTCLTCAASSSARCSDAERQPTLLWRSATVSTWGRARALAFPNPDTVDDSQLQSRAATRALPRPIRFTPSRAEPIPAPPLERAAPDAPSSLASRVLVWLLVGSGWAVFAAWWIIVLSRESVQSFAVALGLLGGTIATSAIAMTLWTRHNIRLARRGKRGKSSLYIPMVFERDTLGRPLAFPDDGAVRTAAEVRIVLRGDAKAYIVPDGEEL